jgi:single-stranded-DNA-specific exonuclease
VTDALQALLGEAVRRLQAAHARSALLVHHNDADGLTSGALLSMALEAVGSTVERLAVEKIFPEVLAAIHARRPPLIVYADLAGQSAGAIAELAREETCTLILDHHRPEPIQAPHVFLMNPELVGLSGDLDSSASALAYLVLRRLVPAGERYADLGVLGALGDGQVVEGALRGLNGGAMCDAEASGSVRRVADDVRMATFTRFDGRPGGALAADFTRLGSVGYYRDGPALALVACRGGFDDRVRACLHELRGLEAERFAAVEVRLQREGLRRIGRVQWFDVGDAFAPMGVKSVGTFCERVVAAEWADPGSYVVGMQPLPGEIPGLGRFEWCLQKVSVRVSADLAREVLAGRSPDLMQLVPAACEAVGGFADGCHRLTAAATIPGDATGRFIQALARAADGG